MAGINGAAYLFMAYFLQRFGEEMTRAVVSQPDNGTQGFDSALRKAGLDLTFEDVFADWTIANYVSDFDALAKQWNIWLQAAASAGSCLG